MAPAEPFGRHRRLTALAMILALAVSPWILARGHDAGNRNALLGIAPSVAKTFDPVRIAPGAATLVTLTLTNPNSTPATLTAELDDALPSPMVIGGGAGTTTCPNGNVSAIGGFAIFALGFGAQIPAEGSCTVAVCVTTDTVGMYVNTIPAGALQTDSGNNVDSANAMLDVTVDVVFSNGFDGGCDAGVGQFNHALVHEAVQRGTAFTELRTRVETGETELVLVSTDGTEPLWLARTQPLP